MITGESGGWTFTDRVLATALILSEDMRCPGCGMPKHEAWNPDSEGWYEHREATCNGCSALQRASDGERAPKPDRKQWAVDTRPADVPLKPWRPDATGR